MDLQNIVDESFAELQDRRGEGRVADYIPALAEVDADRFGIALATRDGACYCAGDAGVPFSIQSISKVFVLALALDRHGPKLFEKVGREPSGDPFNSIVQLEREKGIPRNPFINAGAIVTTDHLIDDRPYDEAVDELVAMLRKMARDDELGVDNEVAQSESTAGARNRSLGYFMESFGVLKNPVETVLAAYFRQCALSLSCKQLAEAGLFLAFDGRDPVTGECVTSTDRCRRINALMLTCGHYDNSGEFAFEVGFCGKSGVGGGILAIVPDRASIAVWSPGLGDAGTSLVGALALQKIAEKTGWSVFG
ncbi:MAG: glutaminase [Pseudomonadota bacterium]